MSENPDRVEIEQQAFASRRSSLFRSVVLGIGFTGIVLGLLPFVLSMSGPLAARCEMLGGLLAIGAGAAMCIFGLMLSRKCHMRVPSSHFLLTAFFVLGGFTLLGKGFFTESTNQRKFDEMKSNLEALSESIKRLESSNAKSNPTD